MDRFLVDECLSVQLVAVAKARAFEADFGPHIGKAGWQDWNLTRFALENDYVFVTNNRRDFLKAYAAERVHNCLIVIVPNLAREAQKVLFGAVLDYLAEVNELPVNTLIEVLEDGSVHQRSWFDSDFDPAHIDEPVWPSPGA
jgi:predicted nuclease of predicted toxin-antitoxin system